MTADTIELAAVQERLAKKASLTDRFIHPASGHRVHVVETGDGPPLVLIHGSGNSGLFLLPVLERLEGVRAIAIDRPGFGQSEPPAIAGAQFREDVVLWLDSVLDELDLDTTSLLGHSMGGLWSVWYALARPGRVRRLVLLGAAPCLPGTQAPLPFRVLATPVLGALVQRRPATRKSVLQFARFVGEDETLAAQPDLLDLMVASSGNPVTKASLRSEVRSILPAHALASPTGFRPATRVRTEELSHLAARTLIVWGEREPVGDLDCVRQLGEMIPNARVEIVPGGHAPWLGEGPRIASMISDFVR